MIPGFLIPLVAFLYSATWVNSQYPEIPCDSVYRPENCANATWMNLLTVEDFVRCAPAKLKPLVRDYIWVGSGRQMTLRENYAAYKRIHIKKRCMRDLSRKNLETTILGKKIAFPIAISPAAGQIFCHPDGDAATARGAHDMGTVMVLSSFSGVPLEKVAASVPADANIWLQLYIMPNRSDVIHLIRRAENAGFKALVVTVDEATDTETRCNAFSRFHVELSAPRGLPNLDHPDSSTVDPKATFKEITWLKMQTKLPIVAKGVMTGEDAVALVRAGANAIFVSNHGGRQLDGAIPTIDALPEVVDTLKKWYPQTDVYVDGGIYNGYDVYKAIARGAKAAFIGRANIWGLTMGGDNGVKKVLGILRDEFENAMLHAGYNTPKDISRCSVMPQAPNFKCYKSLLK